MNLVRLIVVACQVIFPGFVSFDLFNIFNNLYGFIPALQFTLCYIFYILFHILLKRQLPKAKKILIIVSKIIFLLLLLSNAFMVFGFTFRFIVFAAMLILVEMILYIAENDEK